MPVRAHSFSDVRIPSDIWNQRRHLARGILEPLQDHRAVTGRDFQPVALAAQSFSGNQRRAAAEEWLRDDAAFWQPAPLLARLVAEGKTFN